MNQRVGGIYFADTNTITDIFRDHPERRRECLYYLALGNYRLGNYAEARRYNEALLDNEPQNLQSQSLRTLIDDKVAKGGLWPHITAVYHVTDRCGVLFFARVEGLLGVAIISGVALAAGVLGSALWRGMVKRR